MKRLFTAVAAIALLAGAAGAASAQPYGDHHDRGGPMMDHPGGPHPDWRRGGRIGPDDWSRGERVDYRAHHFRRPPRGYEWRQVDGNYVLAAVATGVIASVLLSH